MIDGVIITPLRQIPDERGKIMHMLRSDAPHFQQFGEIYFSCIYPGAIKALHIHKVMTLNYAVVHGMIKFVLHDDRPDSPTRGETQEIFMGEQNYCLVTVPPMVIAANSAALMPLLASTLVPPMPTVVTGSAG
jgi:dTDP-4-dehydrorhamnose 3,5-epimerase